MPTAHRATATLTATLALVVTLANRALAQDNASATPPASAQSSVSHGPTTSVPGPAPDAMAPAPQPPRSDSKLDARHRHLGFFFRGDLNVGYLSSSSRFGGSDYALFGPTVGIALSAGGAVVENLVVGGEVWTASAPSPTLRVGRAAVPTTSDTSQSLTGIGPVITYYFMPINVYVAATPSLARLSLETSGTRAATRLGFGSRIAIGKEWWVHHNLGIGLAGNLLFGVQGDEAISQNAAGNTVRTNFYWTTLGAGVGFSLTHN